MNRLCKRHGVTSHFKRTDSSYRCGKCASRWVIDHRIKKKEKLVKLLGGKCKLCGYKKYIGALDFHHTNPKNKSFAVSVRGLSYGWNKILREVRKCTLLCKNCHTEVENGKSQI